MEIFDDEIIKFYYVDGIVHIIYKSEKVDLQVAEHVVKVKLAHLSAGKEYPILVDYTRVRQTTKQARDYFASPTGLKNCAALAILTDMKIGRVMFNFFLRVQKPMVPTMLFDNEADAYAWLKKISVMN